MESIESDGNKPGRSDPLAAVLAEVPFGVTPAQADVSWRCLDLPGTPAVLGFVDRAVDALDLGAEHVGASFLGGVVEIGQQAAQQFQLLLLPLGQAVVRQQLAGPDR